MVVGPGKTSNKFINFMLVRVDESIKAWQISQGCVPGTLGRCYDKS